MKGSRIVVAVIVLFTLTGCSQISQTDYDKVIAERDNVIAERDKLQTDNTALQSERDKLQKDLLALDTEYQSLKNDTVDWVQLSETEKAAKLADAEAERIRAEEAQKKAEAEKAAEEARLKAEEEKQRAAEEAARIAEEKKGYETGITYDQLARTPDDYEGKKVKFTGQVVQVIENGDEVNLRVSTKKSAYGNYIDDVVLVYYNPDIVTSRVLEDDIVTIYGVSKGLYTYDSTMGGSITVPLISIDKIELK